MYIEAMIEHPANSPVWSSGNFDSYHVFLFALVITGTSLTSSYLKIYRLCASRKSGTPVPPFLLAQSLTLSPSLMALMNAYLHLAVEGLQFEPGWPSVLLLFYCFYPFSVNGQFLLL